MSANLFQQYLQPARSAMDYANDFARADVEREQLAGARQTNALNAMTIREKQDALARDAETRNALQRIAATWKADTKPQERVASLRNTGNPALIAQADVLEKADLEAQKVRSEVGKRDGETLDATMARYRGALDFIDTREGAARWLQAQYSDPVLGQYMNRLGTFEEAVQRLPTDPQAFQQWRQQAGMGMDKFLTQQRQQKEYDLKVKNELIQPDGTVNRPLVAARKEIGKASATSVNVSTDNLGLKPKDRFEMEGKLADDYKATTKLDSGVLAATRKITTALGKDGALKDQAAIYSFAKMLDPEGAVRESDYAAIANTAGLLDRVRNYVQRLQTGEQLTPQQRTEMLDVAQAFDQVAQQRIAAAQESYSEQARAYNLRPEAVFGASARQDRAPAPAPAGKPGAAQGKPAVVEWGKLPQGEKP